MEINDIIEAINKVSKTTLILHRSMTVHPKFKIYKVYSYNLYRVDTDKQLLLEWSVAKNTSSDTIGKCWDEADKEYLSILVNWLSSDKYKELKNDEV
jgi:hypothetical protein